MNPTREIGKVFIPLETYQLNSTFETWYLSRFFAPFPRPQKPTESEIEHRGEVSLRNN